MFIISGWKISHHPNDSSTRKLKNRDGTSPPSICAPGPIHAKLQANHSWTNIDIIHIIPLWGENKTIVSIYLIRVQFPPQVFCMLDSVLITWYLRFAIPIKVLNFQGVPPPSRVTPPPWPKSLQEFHDRGFPEPHWVNWGEMPVHKGLYLWGPIRNQVRIPRWLICPGTQFNSPVLEGPVCDAP